MNLSNTKNNQKYTNICCQPGPYPPFPDSIGKEVKERKEKVKTMLVTDTPNKNEIVERTKQKETRIQEKIKARRAFFKTNEKDTWQNNIKASSKSESSDSNFELPLCRKLMKIKI